MKKNPACKVTILKDKNSKIIADEKVSNNPACKVTILKNKNSEIIADEKVFNNPACNATLQNEKNTSTKKDGKIKKLLLLKRVLSYSKNKKLYIALSFIFTIGAVATTLLLPVIIGQAIDSIIGVGQVDFSTILIKIAIIAATTVVGFVCQWLASVYTTSLSYFITQGIRDDFFAHLNKLPISSIDTASHGDVVSRLTNDVEIISAGLLQGFSSLFNGIITIFGTLGIMLYINPLITAVVVVLTPLSLFIANFIAKRIHKQFATQANLQGKATGFIQEKLGGQKTTKAFCREQTSLDDFAKINSDLYDCGVKAQFYSALTNPFTRFVNNIVYAFVGVVGILLAVFKGGVSAGTITTFLMYSNQYTKPFNEISGVMAELQGAFASADRVFEFLDIAEESNEDSCKKLTACDGSITLNNISFGYSCDKMLINNLSLKILPGQKVALIGKTGCGKTTFINLLMRFYDVNNGEILLSGQNVNSLTRASLRGQFGMVLQESWLFGGTIKENISFGMPNASDKDIISAATDAGADDFIQKLPLGYNTLIQGDGQNLSQGQRQLLCLARIMLAKPPMLILDEATSNIDTRTECKINVAFERLLQGKTSIIVAHRLTTIQSADVILVMKDGDIVESGNHKQLLASETYYKQLYFSQYDAENQESEN